MVPKTVVEKVKNFVTHKSQVDLTEHETVAAEMLGLKSPCSASMTASASPSVAKKVTELLDQNDDGD